MFLCYTINNLYQKKLYGYSRLYARGIKMDFERGDASADGIIEGRNSVMEALKAGRKIDKLFVIQDSKSSLLREIIRKAKETGALL